MSSAFEYSSKGYKVETYYDDAWDKDNPYVSSFRCLKLQIH